MILTPESDGKYLFSAGLITPVMSSNLSFTSSDKATTDIKQKHVETNLSSHVKDTAGIRDGLHEGLRISTATSIWKLTPMTSMWSSFAPKGACWF